VAKSWLQKPSASSGQAHNPNPQTTPAAASGQASSYLFRGLDARPVWDPCSSGDDAISALCLALESSYAELRREAVAFLRQSLLGNDESDGSSEAGSEVDDPGGGGDSRTSGSLPCWSNAHGEGLVTRGLWHKVLLWTGRTRHHAACARLPAATAIIERFAGSPIMLEPPGRVFLSLMLPGTHIAPHAGPTNHRLRMHLPLVLPPPALDAASGAQPTSTDAASNDCGPPFLIVGNRRCTWEEGRCLLFDDSFVHEVHYPAKQGSSAAAPSTPAGSTAGLKRGLDGEVTAAHGSSAAAPSTPAGNYTVREPGVMQGGDSTDEDPELAALLRSVRLLVVIDVWHPQAASGPFPVRARRGWVPPAPAPAMPE